MIMISGGQTGADRAALDFAIAHDIEHSGWCPLGRRAEDGLLDAKYRLVETEWEGYRARTVRNVRESDATLILNLDELEGGSLETMRIAQRRGKPVRAVQLDAPPTDAELDELREWLRVNAVARLNVAGPRESKRPGIYQAARAMLER
jgi:hypothetical protein